MFVNHQDRTALKNSYLHMQIPGTHTSSSSFTFSSFYRQASKQMQLKTVSKYGGKKDNKRNQAQYPEKDLHKQMKNKQVPKNYHFMFLMVEKFEFLIQYSLKAKTFISTIYQTTSSPANKIFFSDTVFLHVLFGRKYFSAIKIPSVFFFTPFQLNTKQESITDILLWLKRS